MDPNRILAMAARVSIGLWTGAVLAVAFVAAPLVFAAVPEWIATKDQAARVIGPAFGRVDLLGIAAAALGLLVLLRQPPARGLTWRRGLLLVMLVAAALDAFWIAPAITARQAPLGTWHAAATGLWMLILVGGLSLMARGLVPELRKIPQSDGQARAD